MRVKFRLNGDDAQVDVAGDEILLDFLRQRGLRGSKEGCGVGVCGACTVLVDRNPVSSCIYLAGAVAGREVWTVEGIARHFPEIVQAFAQYDGFQCGACTPGQVVMTAALKLRGGRPDEGAIREFLAGNLCRCTGYRSIVDSVRAALDS